jgi:hypothetical protein
MYSNATLPIFVKVYAQSQFPCAPAVIECVLTIVWDLLIVLDGLKMKLENAILTAEGQSEHTMATDGYQGVNRRLLSMFKYSFCRSPKFG